MHLKLENTGYATAKLFQETCVSLPTTTQTSIHVYEYVDTHFV